MSYQRRIHDYLNGDLTSDEEKSLFDELSDNPTFREELAMQIKLQQTVQKDMASNAISPATTAAIFSALNFAIPVKNVPSTPRRRFDFGPKSFGANVIIFGLVFAIAVVSLVYVLSPSQTSQIFKASQRANNPVQSQSNSGNIDLSRSNNNIPLIHDTDHAQTQKQTLRTSDQSTYTANSKNVDHRIIPNEPMKIYFDIGKFSSVDYLTSTKIIGVADGGMIYYSDNGGKSWAIQTSGTSNDLSGINFIDTTQGIIVGSRGTILLTNNAGHEWHPEQSGIETNLIAIRYATKDTVFACGAQGTIIRSTTGGETWEQLESGTRLSLFKLFFENGSKGFATGEHGIRLETQNAGTTWHTKK